MRARRQTGSGDAVEAARQGPGVGMPPASVVRWAGGPHGWPFAADLVAASNRVISCPEPPAAWLPPGRRRPPGTKR